MSDEKKRARSSDEIKRLVEGEAHGQPAAPSFNRDKNEGDGNGPYGYGHRAHQPDPAAHYGFAPKPERLLPSSRPRLPEPKIIWKRPLR